MVVPTLVSADPACRFIRVANLSQEDQFLPARTPVTLLHAVKSVDSNDSIQITAGVNELVVSVETHSHPPTTQSSSPAPCPDFDGTSSQHQRLQELFAKHAAVFTKDDTDLGYMDAAYHHIRTTDAAPQWPSPTVASPHTSSRRCRNTSRDS